MSHLPELSLQVLSPNSSKPKVIPKVTIGISIVDANHVILQANTALGEYLGYPLEELIGMTIDEITFPDDLDRTFQAFQQLESLPEPSYTYEKRYRRKNGAIVWSLTTVNRLALDEQNGRQMYIGFVDDITAQKTAQEELYSAHQLYRGLVENIGVGLALVDRNHRIRMVNPALAELLGRIPGDLVGKQCYQEFESREGICSHCPGVVAMRTGQPHSVETRAVCLDGEHFRVRIKAFPFFDPDGSEAGFVEMVEDLSRQYAAEIALHESEQRFQVLAETAPIGIVEFSADGMNTYSNPAWSRMTGLTSSESSGDGWLAAIPPEDRSRTQEVWSRATSRGLPWQKEQRLLHRNGNEHWVQVTATPIRNEYGQLLHWVAAVVDLTVQKNAMQRLVQSEGRFRSIYEKSSVGMNLIAGSGQLIDGNPAFCDFLGYSQDELKTLHVRDITHPEDLEETERVFEALAGQEEHYNYQKRFVRKDGKIVWGQVSAVVIPGAEEQAAFRIGIIQDITKKKEAQERIEYLSYHDELTGLPNKRLLMDRLRHAIDKAARSKSWLGVLFVGLDRFSKIADTLDQESVSLVLCEIAERLQVLVRKADTLARIGDTELVIVLEDTRDLLSARSVAQRILRQTRQPITVAGQVLHVTASLGISIFPEDGEQAEHLLRTASTAMHRAKRQGGDMFEFFVPELNRQTRELLALEMNLHSALENQELVLYYQPQIQLASKRVIGFEALLRWRHPQRGLVPPADFIPLAEETGIIVPIGEWVLEEACRQNMAWHQAGLPLVRMAVNISPRQLRRADVPALVRRVLGATGHPPEFLELEITESMIMEDVDRAIEFMKELAEMGVHLAIDDFGTGYSSMHSLQRFPVQRLKVDRTFVKDVSTNSSDAAIASAIVALAKAMNLEVLAEGIETQEQLGFFMTRGCDFCQGYLFSKPLEAGRAEAYLLANGVG